MTGCMYGGVCVCVCVLIMHICLPLPPVMRTETGGGEEVLGGSMVSVRVCVCVCGNESCVC